MKTLAELQEGITRTFSTQWKRTDGTKVPAAEDLVLQGNVAINLDGTVLYADLVESTGLVQGHKDWFAAEIFKNYLWCSGELIRNNGGTVTAYDGDRVMGVFVGSNKNTSAAKCALQINHIVTQEINPAIKKQYPDTTYVLKHAIGIDTSKLMVARTGVWGANDLVWIGRSANFAAKLCGVRNTDGMTFITEDVYTRLADESKYGGNPKQDMWTKFMWTEFGTIAYKTNWRWKPD
jgi:class 3 adenylate cyclase